MKLLYEKHAKFAMPRAVFFAITGIVALLFSGFLQGTVFYVVVGYVFLCGIWCIADYFLCGKETSAPVRYVNLITAVLMIAFATLSIIYGRYLVHVAPLYLGGLMLVNGLVYFVAAVCAKAGLQWLLTLLSMTVIIGGGAIVIFTLGFEIVLTLAQISCVTLLVASTYELVTYLVYRKSIGNSIEGDKTK